MAKVTPNIIDNLAFYTYGRLEREIEGLAERTGLSKSDFTGRLSALLGNTPVWPILGDPNPMSPMQEKTEPAGVHIQQPTLALGEPAPSHGVHHDQSAQVKTAARSKVALELMKTLEQPIFCSKFHKALMEKGEMSYAAAHHVTTRMAYKRILVKHGEGGTAQFTWPEGQQEEVESTKGKAARNRVIMAEVMRELTSPARQLDFHHALKAKGIKSLSTARNLTDRFVRKGILQKRNGDDPLGRVAKCRG